MKTNNTTDTRSSIYFWNRSPKRCNELVCQDDEYNKDVVEEVIRSKLVTLATKQAGYTSVLMQGSGTASVEATIGSVIS